jgi:hypothetical protein
MAKKQHDDFAQLDDEAAPKSLSADVPESPLGPQRDQSPFQAQELPIAPQRPAGVSSPVERSPIRSSPRETLPPTMERQRHRLRPLEEMPPESTGSRMHIDKSEYPDGFDLQFITKSVYGQEQPSHTRGSIGGAGSQCGAKISRVGLMAVGCQSVTRGQSKSMAWF